MAYFAISYDLVKDKDYKSLISDLKRLGAVKSQLSFWLAQLDSNAEDVKTRLAKHMDDDDKLMVIEFSKEPEWTRGIKGTKTWIEARF